jgi:hypothetical protein
MKWLIEDIKYYFSKEITYEKELISIIKELSLLYQRKRGYSITRVINNLMNLQESLIANDTIPNNRIVLILTIYRYLLNRTQYYDTYGPYYINRMIYKTLNDIVYVIKTDYYCSEIEIIEIINKREKEKHDKNITEKNYEHFIR